MQETLMPKPGHRNIRAPADAAPYIEGYRCTACGAVVAEQTICCRRCSARVAPEPFRAASSGRLYSWSVVERSFPGVAVPFVSAIVDLDDGLTIKGTLLDTPFDAIRAGMPVALVFDDAGGARAEDGAAYVGFHFTPAKETKA